MARRGYSKYRAKKTEYQGIVFDSQKEADAYVELMLMKKAGIVTEVELQPVFTLQPAFTKGGQNYRAIKYQADFKVTYKAGYTEIIDVKGYETDVFKIKRKLFEYKYSDLTLKLI